MRVALAGILKNFELDQNVAEEHAAGTDLFFVLRGRAKIIKQGGGGEEQVHEEIGSGRVFGERALVTKDSRSATVRVMASSRSLASEK
ncbi:MAG: cyclic nucleotide-binding domain-containing protein [Roseibacillus sp.]|nr:cyclic nucleotide-binding domain-containing protein [Roseibacillus sp.]|tara:strand:+ start:196 stop:459 length:264 start_codon:yes stop_codon:yes gene_type:complete